MDGEQWYGAAYKGSKQFNQWEVPLPMPPVLAQRQMIIWNAVST
jgi:hypothetical protein